MSYDVLFLCQFELHLITINNYTPYTMSFEHYQRQACGAIQDGDKDQFNQIISNAPSDYEWNWQLFLINALVARNTQMFPYLLSYIIKRGIAVDWNSIARNALIHIGPSLLEWVRSVAPANFELDFSRLASCAIIKNNGTWDYVLAIAPEDYQWDYNDLAVRAIFTDNIDLFETIRSSAPSDHVWNWTWFAKNAGICHTPHMLNHILNVAPVDTKWDWNCILCSPLSVNNAQMFDFIRYNIVPRDYQLDWDRLIKTKGGGYAKEVAPADYKWADE
jgi:hypothetical protein